MQAGKWSSILAQSSAWIGVAFTALMTVSRIGPTDTAIKDLGRWDTFAKIVSAHQIGAVVTVVVLAASIYPVYDKFKKTSGK